MSSIAPRKPFYHSGVLRKAIVDDKPISQHGEFTLKMLLNSWDHKTTNSAHIELHISCRVHKFKSLRCCHLALVAAAYNFNRLLCEVWVDYLPFNIREHKFSTFHRRKEKFVVLVCLFYPKRISLEHLNIASHLLGEENGADGHLFVTLGASIFNSH